MTKATPRATESLDWTADTVEAELGRLEGLAVPPETSSLEELEFADTSVGEVVGRNVKRLREGLVLTQHELSQRWLRQGLVWARSKIASLEGGKRPRVDLGDLPLMAEGLDVLADELLAGKGSVRLEPNSVLIDLADLRRTLRGEALQGQPWIEDETLRARAREQVAAGLYANDEGSKLVDIALAQRLGVPSGMIETVAQGLFNGRNLTTERDRRVAALGASWDLAERQAHRGHITRELAAMVQARIESLEVPKVEEHGRAAGQGQPHD